MFKPFFKTFLRAIIFFQIIQISISITYAGDLAQFESNLAQEESPIYFSNSDNCCSNNSCSFGDAFLGEVFGELFGAIFFYGLFAGGQDSVARINSENNLDVVPRDLGEPLIPFMRFDTHYQWVDTDIYALDFRFEGGWGPFGFGFRRTKYNEKVKNYNKDELYTSQLEFLYRMSSSPHFEFDIGIGALYVNGDKDTSGTSVSLPVLIYPIKNIGIEFRPTWTSINGNSVRDYDGCLVFRTSYVSIKGGYRTVNVENESLNGPYVGVSIYF